MTLQVPYLLRQIVASIGEKVLIKQEERDADDDDDDNTATVSTSAADGGVEEGVLEVRDPNEALADAQNRMFKALNLLVLWGNIDGEQEKRWVIVQAIKALIENEAQYDAVVEAMRGGLVVNEEGEFEHEREWDDGVEPGAGDEGDDNDQDDNNN